LPGQQIWVILFYGWMTNGWPVLHPEWRCFSAYRVGSVFVQILQTLNQIFFFFFKCKGVPVVSSFNTLFYGNNFDVIDFTIIASLFSKFQILDNLQAIFIKLHFYAQYFPKIIFTCFRNNPKITYLLSKVILTKSNAAYETKISKKFFYSNKYVL
jgi:hypothetical protein